MGPFPVIKDGNHRFDFSQKPIKLTDNQGMICKYYGQTNSEKHPHGFGVRIREDGFSIEIGNFSAGWFEGFGRKLFHNFVVI